MVLKLILNGNQSQVVLFLTNKLILLVKKCPGNNEKFIWQTGETYAKLIRIMMRSLSGIDYCVKNNIRISPYGIQNDNEQMAYSH